MLSLTTYEFVRDNFLDSFERNVDATGDDKSSIELLKDDKKRRGGDGIFGVVEIGETGSSDSPGKVNCIVDSITGEIITGFERKRCKIRDGDFNNNCSFNFV